MIAIPQPAMVLNAENVPGPDYKMWNTRKVAKDEDPIWVMRNVASVAKGAEGGHLKALVINCHGKSRKIGEHYIYSHVAVVKVPETGGGFGLSLGTGITRANVSAVFAPIAGLVDDIWLVACRAAQITEPGGEGDGNLFCCAMSKTSGANVYASDEYQTTGLWPTIPFGKIDGYEGKVWKYKSPYGIAELTTY